MRRIALACALVLAPSLAWADGTVLDLNSAPYTDWQIVSPGTVPSGWRVLAYQCTAATTVGLTGLSGNTVYATVQPGGVANSVGFRSFFSELPASFSVTGTNSCTFAVER